MEEIVKFFLKPENGILGVIVVALILVVLWEEREKTGLRKEIKDLSMELKLQAEKQVTQLLSIKDADFAILEKIRIAEAEKTDRLRDMVSSVLSIAQNLQTLFNLKGKD